MKHRMLEPDGLLCGKHLRAEFQASRRMEEFISGNNEQPVN